MPPDESPLDKAAHEMGMAMLRVALVVKAQAAAMRILREADEKGDGGFPVNVAITFAAPVQGGHQVTIYTRTLDEDTPSEVRVMHVDNEQADVVQRMAAWWNEHTGVIPDDIRDLEDK